MLSEVPGVRQNPGEGRRRWFSDREMDLIVWLDGSDGIAGFQLCYDRDSRERALTWMRDRGFSHRRVDDGESVGHLKRTPILVPDGVFDGGSVTRRFRELSSEIDSEIADFVLEALARYPAWPDGGPSSDG